MIDHVAARRLAAAALDGALEPEDAAALDGHLRDCAECRRVSDAMRQDAVTLGRLDLGPVPVTVRANLAIAAEHRGRGGHVGRWVGLVAVGALLLVALGGGALGGGSADPTAPPGNAISWHTDVVDLQAADFGILAGGKTFTARVPKVDVSSDPGDATYRTLEVTWQEHGVEQRLYLYFGGDATSWWVDEIRIYNGTQQAEWLYAKGPFFRSPLGTVWRGNQDIEMQDADHVGGTPARIHLGGLALASRPFDGVNEPAGGGGIVLGESDRPFGPGGPLHCSGILQMAPAQAEAQLLALGYSLSWRLDRTTGPNSGFSEPHKRAPAGVITEDPLPGSHGELIMFVSPFGDERAVPVPFPDDCPVTDPNAAPPTPVVSPAP